MGLIKRFEDIEAWQEARALTKQMYQLSGTDSFGHDFGLRDQIRRASVSARWIKALPAQTPENLNT